MDKKYMDKKYILNEIIFMPERLHSLQTISPCEFLKKIKYFEHHHKVKEQQIEDLLLENPDCLQRWLQYSDDQRCIPVWIFYKSKSKDDMYEVKHETDNGFDQIYEFLDPNKACAFYIKQEIEAVRKVCTTGVNRLRFFFYFKMALISGIVFSGLLLPALVMEIWRGYLFAQSANIPSFLNYSTNVLMMLLSLSAIPFGMGFVAIGKKVSSKLIRYTSLIAVMGSASMLLLTSFMLFRPAQYFYSEPIFVTTTVLATGLLGVLFGIGVLIFKDKIGRYAQTVGILSILFGVSFIFYITSIVGFIFLLLPLCFLELMILDRFAEKYEG